MKEQAMTDASEIARKTAKRLSPKYGDALPLTVEKTIHGAAGKPGQFIDIATLVVAALIVRCAHLAFEWRKSKGGAGKPDVEVLKLELRLELGRPEGISEKTRDDVIDAVAEETEGEE